jgi:hypothetical protein
MNNHPLVAFFDQLDLTDDVDLHIAFHNLRHYPKLTPMDTESSIEAIDTIQQFGLPVFGQPDGPDTTAAVRQFILQLGGVTPAPDPDHPKATIPKAPRTWLHVFRVAFERGDIGPIAFGAAYRFFTVCTEGNGAPTLEPDSMAARYMLLDDVRRASPLGLMDADERKVLADLPATVELWRGGRGNRGETPLDRAQGQWWALDREYALNYLFRRGRSRSVKTVLEGLQGLSMFSVGHPLIPRKRSTREALGEPFLVKAMVPREMVMAYFMAGASRQCVELIVDFEQLTPEMVVDATPEEFRFAA